MKIIKLAQGRPYETIEKQLSYPFRREAPVGKPLSSIRREDHNICLRSSASVKKLLVSLNMPFGYSEVTLVALSPASYVEKDQYITHYAQITEIDGKRFVVDDPQINFVGTRDLLDSPPEVKNWRKEGPARIEQDLMSKWKDSEFEMEALFYGGDAYYHPMMEDYKMSPFFENVREENGYIYGEKNGVEVRWSKETGFEWNTETMDLSKDLMFLKETFDPILIPATVKHIQEEYGTDEERARRNMSRIMQMPMIYPGTKHYIEEQINSLNSKWFRTKDEEKRSEIKSQIKKLEEERELAPKDERVTSLVYDGGTWEGD
jgi:hypothetical protein